ncbi:MAG: transcriptional regulator NrdR [Chlamydiales bacterium]
MLCPFCKAAESKVIDSRDAPDSNAIRRRRECLACQKRFTTYETVELTIQVLKRDGRYEDFQQHKLIHGLLAACSHTTISRDQVMVLASSIKDEIMGLQTKEVTTRQIGEIVMKHLQQLDPIAYIRFACVYKRFKRIGDFVEVIKTIHAKDEVNESEEVFSAT